MTEARSLSEDPGPSHQTAPAFQRAVLERDLKGLRALFKEYPELAAEIDSPRIDVGRNGDLRGAEIDVAYQKEETMKIFLKLYRDVA